MARRNERPEMSKGTAGQSAAPMSRRSFAAAVGATALAVGLTGCAPKGKPADDAEDKTVAKDSVALAQQEELEKFVVTSGYNCNYCTLQGRKRDGKIVYIEPGQLPEDSFRSNGCARCMAWPQHAFDENARVMHPMKRKEGTERGAGEWEEITWDEAIDLIAEKLNKVLADDPRNATFWNFTGNMNLLSMFAASRMGACLGCSLWLPEGIMGDGAATEGFTMVTGNPDPGHDALDFTNSKLVIFFGCNIADNITPSVRFLTQAKEAGARIVVIDPRMSSTASIADEWIPINPGTDTALILSMMNVIIANGLHDETWLKNYSCGPLLVSDADGKYVRNAEGEILAWDTAANAAVAASASAGEDDQTSGPESTLALTGNFTVNGVACHPSFEDLCAEVAEWTPEKASEITGIPAAKIEELALEYGKADPAAIQTNTGSSRYYYGYELPRSAATLSGLCGYTGRAGGGASRNNGGNPINGELVSFTGEGATLFNSGEWDCVGPDGGAAFGDYGANILGLYGYDPETHASNHLWKSSQIYDAAINRDPVGLDFFYIATSNFINQSPDAHKVIEEVFPAIDFIVTADPFWTWTAQYSDVVLPVSTWLENWDISTQGAFVRINKPVVERFGDSKSDTEIMTMLAKKVGCETDWQKTDEEWVRTYLDSGHPAFGDLTVDEMIEAGVVARKDGVWGVPTYPLGDKVFNTRTGRLEFYTESLVPFDDQVPTYRRDAENPENRLADKYPLIFTQHHDRRRVHTQHSGIELLDIMESEPTLYINVEDAEARGIKQGDMVRLFNDRGSVTLKAFVTPGIIKGAVTMPQGWEPKDFVDGHYQFLTTYDKNPTEEFISMTNAAFYDVRAEVEKA